MRVDEFQTFEQLLDSLRRLGDYFLSYVVVDVDRDATEHDLIFSARLAQLVAQKLCICLVNSLRIASRPTSRAFGQAAG